MPVKESPEVIRIDRDKNLVAKEDVPVFRLSTSDILFDGGYPLAILYLPITTTRIQYTCYIQGSPLKNFSALPVLLGKNKPTCRLVCQSNPKGIGITLNDTGITFIEAKWVDVTINDLAPQTPIRDVPVISSDLMPPDSDGSELMSVQFTILGCGALAVSINTNHMLLTQAANFTHVEYITDFESITASSTFGDPACSHKIFHASKDLLDSLKHAASKYFLSVNSSSTFVSTLDCLQAHITSLFYLNTVVNGRKRLQPPIPSSYSGNAIFNSVLYLSLIGLTAQTIRSTLTKMTPEYLDDAIHHLASLPGGPASLIRRLQYHGGRVLFISSWVGMGLRDADFGFGQPKYAGLPFIAADGFATLADSERGSGVDVILCLQAEHMTVFERLWM
ncbi:transferase family-domain-containing protein, partial [Chytridium lagenaria]